MRHIKEKYKDFMYIEVMPEDKKNVPFYEKHGFIARPTPELGPGMIQYILQ